MSRVAVNIVANFVGRGGAVLLTLALIPLYVKWMGIEAYGLISIYTTVQALVSLFDLGFSAVVAREAAKTALMMDHRDNGLAYLFRTIELVIWFLSVSLIVVGIFVLPHTTANWIEAKTLDSQVISQSLTLITCTAATRLPINLYTGLLIGLQKQVSANFILFFGNLIRGLGSIFVLLVFEKSILAFFSWQFICSLIELTCAMFIAWSTQGVQFFTARFELSRLYANWKFATGVVTVTLTAAAIAQLDKLILSKLLSLELFGYYALGATIAYGLFNLVYPVCVAASPRFTSLLDRCEFDQLSATYHLLAQLCTILAMPVAIILMFYGTEILTLYLGNYEQALKVEPFLTLVTLGTSVAILSPLPHTLQIASGWTRLISICNIVFALLYTSTLLFVTQMQGVEITIKIWIVLNCVYLIILASFMHRRLLIGEFWQWMSRDICTPVALGLAAAYLTNETLKDLVLHPLLRISLCYAVVLVVITSSCLRVRRVIFDRVTIFFRQ